MAYSFPSSDYNLKSTERNHHATQHNTKYHNLSPALTALSSKTLISTRLQLRI